MVDNTGHQTENVIDEIKGGIENYTCISRFIYFSFSFFFNTKRCLTRPNDLSIQFTDFSGSVWHQVNKLSANLLLDFVQR